MPKKPSYEELEKRVEELEKERAKYQILTESIKDVVWVLDLESLYFSYVSPSVERLRGYTPEEVMALPVNEALTTEGAEELSQLMYSRIEAIQSGEDSFDTYYIDEVLQPCKDGSTVWTEVITNYSINPVTQKLELRGVTREITERKKVEQRRDELILKLQNALQEIKVLRGIIPICMHCKKIRDDEGYWKELEGYVARHSEIQFSHSICNSCMRKHYPFAIEDEGCIDGNKF